jgi:hypothetical protein
MSDTHDENELGQRQWRGGGVGWVRRRACGMPASIARSIAARTRSQPLRRVMSTNFSGSSVSREMLIWSTHSPIAASFRATSMPFVVMPIVFSPLICGYPYSGTLIGYPYSGIIGYPYSRTCTRVPVIGYPRVFIAV